MFQDVSKSILAAIPLLAVVTTTTVDAQSHPEPRLELPIILVDSIGRPQEVIARLQSELARLLEPAAIQPVWLTPSTADRGPFVGHPPFAVKVLLWKSAPPARRPAGEVLAEVLEGADAGGQGDTMFLIWPAIAKQLRRSNGTLFSAPEEGRALARIVFHELAHLLVPQRAHAAEGLMAPGVTRRLLVREAWIVGPDWLRDLRNGLLRALEQPDQ